MPGPHNLSTVSLPHFANTGERTSLFKMRQTEVKQAEYGVSLTKLLPLKQRLAATDRLIDRVVYRLYGLADEEIAVVEGKG
jgi:hypothetical protein